MSLALRRHYAAVAKQRAVRRLLIRGLHLDESTLEPQRRNDITLPERRLYLNVLNPKLIGIESKTPARCSCWMCGNMRRTYGESIRDRRQSQADAEEV